MSTLMRDDLGPQAQFVCGALLTLLMTPSLLTVDVLQELDDAMREVALDVPPIRLEDRTPVAIVGSGKDQFKTFNISTCAAFVAAGCGGTVAKVGCGAETSVAGAYDVLAGLGFDTKRSAEESLDDLRAGGFAVFDTEAQLPQLFAMYIGRTPVFTALEYVLPNYIGVGIPTVVYGLADDRTELAGELMLRHQHGGLVVAGTTEDRLAIDELSVTGPSRVTQVRRGVARTFGIVPADLGLPKLSARDIEAGRSRAEAVSIARSVLQGKGNEAQAAAVAVNAAAILLAGDVVDDLRSGVDRCLVATKEGAGWDAAIASLESLRR